MLFGFHSSWNMLSAKRSLSLPPSSTTSCRLRVHRRSSGTQSASVSTSSRLSSSSSCSCFPHTSPSLCRRCGSQSCLPLPPRKSSNTEQIPPALSLSHSYPHIFHLSTAIWMLTCLHGSLSLLFSHCLVTYLLYLATPRGHWLKLLVSVCKSM